MDSSNSHSERFSLLFQLQNRCEKFDSALANDEEFKTARIIYREIKGLRERLKEMEVSTTGKVENIF
jgi:hypothetical protein